MAYQMIRLEHIGPVARIVLDRPDRLNACPPAMAREVSHALAHLGEARAVLLTGEGRSFCSGADLTAASAGESIAGGEGAYRALTEAYNPLILNLVRLPTPVVAAVNGAAAGIGCSIALTADFVIAGQTAYFLQAFSNIGLVPDGGASWMLPRLVGKARATQMMMLGEKIPAAQAADWGLIYKCVEDAALAEEGLALATRLASGPTLALGTMRQTMRRALECDLGEALMLEAEGQWKAGDSADAAEGIAAFLQKRKANFTGR